MHHYVSMVANFVVFAVLLGVSGFCLYRDNTQGCALAVGAASLVGLLILFRSWHIRNRKSALKLSHAVHSAQLAHYASCCSICLTDFVESEKVTLLFCKHAFHKKCFESWMEKSSSCPHCRAEFRDPDLAN